MGKTIIVIVMIASALAMCSILGIGEYEDNYATDTKIPTNLSIGENLSMNVVLQCANMTNPPENSSGVEYAGNITLTNTGETPVEFNKFNAFFGNNRIHIDDPRILGKDESVTYPIAENSGNKETRLCIELSQKIDTPESKDQWIFVKVIKIPEKLEAGQIFTKNFSATTKH